MKKIRILFVSRTLGLGGTEKTLEILATNLNRNLFEVYVAATDTGGPRQKNLEFKKIPVKIFNGNFESLNKYIEKMDFDILHLHQVEIPLNLLEKRKVILSHHFSKNVFSFDIEKEFSVVTFNSGHTLLKYLNKNQTNQLPENFLVLYNPINVEGLEKNNKSITSSQVSKQKKILGISGNDFVVGRLGRADIVKWSDFLLEAVPLLVKLIPNIKIILQSIPESRIKRIRRSKYTDHFVILPESIKDQDIALFFKLIDVYVHSSKIGESFGVSIAEAMALKKPVVVNSTPNADNAQIEVVDNNKTGFVVKYPSQFALAIFELYKNKNLRNKMGQASYQKVIKNYSVKIILSQYESLLLSLVNNKELVNKTSFQAVLLEYKKRLTNLYGNDRIFDKVDNMAKMPSRFINRVGDYIEFKKRK